MIQVKLFALLRERVGVDHISWPAKAGMSIRQLQAELIAQGDGWIHLGEGTVLCALNQQIVSPDSPVTAGDEVAFFPPVTGG